MTSQKETASEKIFYYWEAPGPERYAFGICSGEEEVRRIVENEIRAQKAEYGTITRAQLHSDDIYALVPCTSENADPQPGGSIKWTAERNPFQD
ncbi:MAG TPA: hypothetical protein VGG75_08775 [Trebonia sp.]|jgi:hypothetical protein